MKNITLTMVTAAAVPALAFAQDHNSYQCSNGDLQRRIEIVYETGVTVPCEVHYYKDTEAPGERQVLWRALRQEGYCEEKTRDFVTQLGSWGWDCTQSSGATSEEAQEPEETAEPDAADDTEEMAPVE